MRGADLIVKILKSAGVDIIYSLSGNQIMPIYDACIDADIRIIHTRHEAAAVYMAEAHAQLSGEIGVALVTAGVGAANAIGPLFTSKLSQSPVLLLTGDSPVSQDEKGAFQELNQSDMTRPATKYSSRIMSIDTIHSEFSKAISTALTPNQGPVHLALPFDVVEAEISDQTELELSIDEEKSGIANVDIAGIQSALLTAQRPLILVGPSLNTTRRQRLNYDGDAETLQTPIIPMESPRGLRDPALGKFATGLKQADLIIIVGKSVDFTLGFGNTNVWDKDAEWIVINNDETQIAQATLNLGDRLSSAIVCEPDKFLDELIASIAQAPDREEWVSNIKSLTQSRSYSHDIPQQGAITSRDLCLSVNNYLSHQEQSLLICDGGEFGQWSQAAITANERLVNGISGAIGSGICFGLAARFNRPDATIFCMMGDGTAGFHFMEFETAIREELPFIVIIGNDQCWNAEHQIQLREYGPDRLIGCQLSGARYDLMIEAMGGHGEYVDDLSQLAKALDRANESGKPSCVNVQIEGLAAPSAS